MNRTPRRRATAADVQKAAREAISAGHRIVVGGPIIDLQAPKEARPAPKGPGREAPDATKTVAAIAKAVGLGPNADGAAIVAAVAELVRTRGIEQGARQLGMSPKKARELAAMPAPPRRKP